MSTPAEVFAQGCHKVFSCWTALNLAVENHWGGAESEQKRDDFVQQVINFCISRKEVFRDEIEDILVDKLDEYFSVVLEDGSDVEVAEILVKLHSNCSKGDFTYAKELVENLKKCQSNQCVAKPGDDDEEEGLENDDPESHNDQVKSQSTQRTRGKNFWIIQKRRSEDSARRGWMDSSIVVME